MCSASNATDDPSAFDWDSAGSARRENCAHGTERGGLVLCQDSYREEAQSLFGLTPQGGIFQFAENNGIYENFHGLTGDYTNSEFAGACFSPDGRWLFVNVYTPGFTVAITGPWKEGLL